jgi:hypothetical protein
VLPLWRLYGEFRKLWCLPNFWEDFQNVSLLIESKNFERNCHMNIFEVWSKFPNLFTKLFFVLVGYFVE